MIKNKWFDGKSYGYMPSRHQRYSKLICGSDREASSNLSRKTKKYFFGTRRHDRRVKLQNMRIREHCKHEVWGTHWTPIPGEEHLMEPAYDVCEECGITEMELKPYWKKYYPKKVPKRRKRAIWQLRDSLDLAYKRGGNHHVR